MCVRFWFELVYRFMILGFVLVFCFVLVSVLTLGVYYTHTIILLYYYILYYYNTYIYYYPILLLYLILYYTLPFFSSFLLSLPNLSSVLILSSSSIPLSTPTLSSPPSSSPSPLPHTNLASVLLPFLLSFPLFFLLISFYTCRCLVLNTYISSSQSSQSISNNLTPHVLSEWMVEVCAGDLYPVLFVFRVGVLVMSVSF